MSIGDRINPVTVKELRQMVRSRLVAAGLIGQLAFQLIGVMIVLLSSREKLQSGSALLEGGLGGTVFNTVFFVLSLVLLLCVPAYAGVRMGAERSGEHLDLQYTTALRPRQFADGKVAAAAILILLFVSAALPFLALSYLLRGLDVLQAMLATAMLVLVSVCCVYEALFLATAATSRAFRVIILLFALGFHFSLLGMVNTAGMAMVSFGEAVSLTTWSDAALPATILGCAATLCLLLRAAVVALITPPSANRAAPLRRCITGLWFVWGVIAFVAAWVREDLNFVLVWALLGVIAAAGFAVVATSYPPGYSRRVLGEVADAAGKRARQFLFFSGAENGMVWALFLGLASVAAAAFAETAAPDSWRPPAGDDVAAAWQLAGFFCYLTAYVWTVRAVWRAGLAKWVTYRLAGVFAAGLALLGWVLPALVALGRGRGSAAWRFGNPFFMFSDDAEGALALLPAAGVFAALALAANLPGLFAATRQFAGIGRRAASVPPADAAAEAAKVAPTLRGGGEADEH